MDPIAVKSISDPTKIRVQLLASGQDVHAPLNAVAGASIHGATLKATPVDADEFGYYDSVSAGPVKATWANIKAALKTYFDTLYLSISTPRREVLTAARTYYVRTDGSDSNNGLTNAAGGAFLTIQKAIDTVAALDISTNTVTIQVVSGTYTGAVVVTGPWIGSGTVILAGDTTTPANCTMSVAGTALNLRRGARLSVQGMKLTNSAGRLVIVESFSVLTLSGNNEFGASTGHCMVADSGRIDATAPEILSGNSGGAHYLATNKGVIYCQSATWTASVSVNMASAFASAIDGTIYAFLNTSSGTVTGARYSATLNGVINTNGGGASYFPGSVAGSTATGGQYA